MAFSRLFKIPLYIFILLTISACCNTPKDENYPAKPGFNNLLFDSDRNKHFGELKYTPWWGKGAITITNGWDSNYLVKTHIPQLKGIIDYNNKRHSGYTRINKNIALQYKMLWHAWEKKGLLHLVKSWGGGYSARKVTGSYFFLSNHAYGTAFDINTLENGWGKQPARRDKKGSVYDLVPIAHEHGFYWGGHFCTLDGMHFEAALVLNKQQLNSLAKKYNYVIH